jgi:hypothetical protein
MESSFWVVARSQSVIKRFIFDVEESRRDRKIHVIDVSIGIVACSVFKIMFEFVTGNNVIFIHPVYSNIVG